MLAGTQEDVQLAPTDHPLVDGSFGSPCAGLYLGDGAVSAGDGDEAYVTEESADAMAAPGDVVGWRRTVATA